MLSGAPHESPKTDDPYHASAVLRKESVGMETGVTLSLTSTERRDGLNCRDSRYLRLGDLAWMLQKDEYAWKLYVARIEATKDTAPDLSPKPQVNFIMTPCGVQQFCVYYLTTRVPATLHPRLTRLHKRSVMAAYRDFLAYPLVPELV